MDQSHTPFLDALIKEKAFEALSFHMPGHRFGADLMPELTAFLGREAFAADVNECSPEVDYLHAPGDRLQQAQRLAAAAVGAETTDFLINGSTVGNQAMLLSVAGDGDEVVVPRASHRSVYAGLILSGARPVYLPARPHPEVGFALATPAADVADALHRHPGARAIHLTSPNYYGYLSDVAAIARLAHAGTFEVTFEVTSEVASKVASKVPPRSPVAAGIPLLVDEAHGAHLAFHRALPRSALAAGADLVVQSPHKSIGALTQAAWLHTRGPRVNRARLTQWLSLLQSSSPSVLLSGSLDASRRLMATQGEALLTRTLALAARARAAIRDIPGLWCYGRELVGQMGIAGHDPTKLVIAVHGCGLSGKAFANALRETARLGVEFADPRNIICSLSIADDDAKVETLVHALRAVAVSAPGHPLPGDAPSDPLPIPPLALSPREALRRPTRAVPLTDSAGAVCAEQIMPYPPGIPLLAPGEIITPELVERLQALLAQGIIIVGPEDTRLQTIRVVA